MGKRLTKIYTRTGDNGTTGLADGSRVPKDHQRVEVPGCLAELNSIIGLSRAHTEADVAPQLAHIQNRLSDLLFALAPVLARRGGGSEVFWQPSAPE